MQGKLKIRIAVSFIAASLMAPAPSAAEIKPEAQRGFDRYVQLTEKRMSDELKSGAPFLQVDALPQEQRQSDLAELDRGEVVSEKLTTSAPEGEIETPGALIHHWVGTVFIPGATLQQVLAILQDYDRHSEYYSPEVQRSKILSRSGNDFTVYYRLKQTDILTVVLDTEYKIHYEKLDANRETSHSYSTRVAEIVHPGSSNERALPPDNDHGFLWRINTYWRFEQTPRGTFVQCEAISLTRDIPTGLGWLAGPLVQQIPKESLEFTLGATRKAVLDRASTAAPFQNAAPHTAQKP
ncbi:MAG: hypothetical protein WBF35_11415 [Candidatus Acidiferrales bacterium]